MSREEAIRKYNEKDSTKIMRHEQYVQNKEEVLKKQKVWRSPGRKSCGKCVRGLLCWRCNIRLGLLESEWAGKGFEYIANPPAKIVLNLQGGRNGKD